MEGRIESFFNTLFDLLTDARDKSPPGGLPDMTICPGEDTKQLLAQSECDDRISAIVQIYIRNEGPSEIVIPGTNKTGIAFQKDQYTGSDPYDVVKKLREENFDAILKAIHKVYLSMHIGNYDSRLTRPKDTGRDFKLEVEVDLRTRPKTTDTTRLIVICVMDTELWRTEVIRETQEMMDAQEKASQRG